LQRLLSDPFSFPLQFKSWIVSYLETSDMSLPMSSVSGLQKTLGITGAGSGTLGTLPAGLIFPYGGDTAPTGSKMCDGGAYPTAVESRLFAAIGYHFGGSGASFNVPDIRERIPIGRGTLAAHDTIGKTENQPLGQRGAAHKHTVLQDNVGWSSNSYNPGAGASSPDGFNPTHELADHNHNVRVGPQSGVPTDTPAFITLNFIIVA